jgi:hypothetical protein
VSKIRTITYVQLSHFENPSCVFPPGKSRRAALAEWRLLSRKRPWERRSLPAAGKDVCHGKRALHRPRRAVRRFFNHLHEDSTTSTKVQRLAVGVYSRRVREPFAKSDCEEPCRRSRCEIPGARLRVKRASAGLRKPKADCENWKPDGGSRKPALNRASRRFPSGLCPGRARRGGRGGGSVRIRGCRPRPRPAIPCRGRRIRRRWRSGCAA